MNRPFRSSRGNLCRLPLGVVATVAVIHPVGAPIRADAMLPVKHRAQEMKSTHHRVPCVLEVEVFLAASIPMAFRAEVHARQEKRADIPRQMCRATEATALAPVAAMASWIAARSVMAARGVRAIAPSAGNPAPTVTLVTLLAVMRRR